MQFMPLAMMRAVVVLPVPGPPEIRVKPCHGARMASSCSAWMVATMSPILPSLAEDMAAMRAPSPVRLRSVRREAASESRSSSSTPVTCLKRV